jgi:guanosine-3',5'-bis(diphosphate) 3'-pyrophosphohydrolase
MQDQEDIARGIATEAHAGQKRWNGDEYITHPERVREQVCLHKNRSCIALLHDVLEDTDMCAGDLIRQGVDPNIVREVVRLTKTGDEEYADYILRVGCSFDASVVKIADLKDNLRDLDLKTHRTLWNKYTLALMYLQTNLETF